MDPKTLEKVLNFAFRKVEKKMNLFDNIQNVDGWARILRVASHPIRLQILEVLRRNGTTRLYDIIASMDSLGYNSSNQAKISQLMIPMVDSGIVSSKRKGKYKFYTLTNPDVIKLLDLIFS